MNLTKTKNEYIIEEIIHNRAKAVRLTGLEHFDIEQVFDCGQCFRFLPIPAPDGAYAVGGVAFGRYVELVQTGTTLIIRNSDMADFQNIWRHYLSLDVDYAEVKAQLKNAINKPVFYDAVKVGHGIRILNQEPWECVCSFIISQNNNIPRIRKIIAALCEKYGDPIHFEGRVHYSFPTAEVIKNAGVDAIFALKTGFRAKYIADAAQRIADGELELDEIFKLDFETAMKKLCEINGVGPKVASCALLFAFEKYSAFPIDVWVKKILEKYFPEGLDIASLGEYAGIAQQYLFYYERYIVSGK